MADYSPRLKQILREHECRFDRPGKGDHEIWFSPITKIKFVVDSKSSPDIQPTPSSNRRDCPNIFRFQGAFLLGSDQANRRAQRRVARACGWESRQGKSRIWWTFVQKLLGGLEVPGYRDY